MSATMDRMQGSIKGRGMGRNKTASDERTYSGRLGVAICARRNNLGMTVDRFKDALAGQRVNVSLQTLYAWEAGTRPIPLDYVPQIAAVLQTTAKRLIPDE